MLVIGQLPFLESHTKLLIFNNCIGIFGPSNIKCFSGTTQNKGKVFKSRINGVERLVFVTKEGQILMNLI